MDLIDIIPSIYDYDQPFDHHDDVEISQIACGPCVEHIIHQNEVPLGLPAAATPRHVKRKAADANGLINPEERKKVKQIIHRDIERQRRHEMATLYASLRSHLPLEFIKGKRSTSDHVHQAGNYIKHLQKNLEELREKKDELKCIVPGSSSSSNTAAVAENLRRPSSIMGDSVIMVRPASCTVAAAAVEVVMNTPLQQGLPVSRVINILIAQGLTVQSCNMAKSNQRLIYTLESEVIDAGERIDITEIQNRLTEQLYR